MNIVLVEPEIPYNAGAIGRTCVAANAVLHLIRPLGFSTDDASVKRSGLDYWEFLNVRYYDDYNDFEMKNAGACMYFATTKAKYNYADVKYSEDDFLVFGKESAGLPEELLLRNKETCIRVPMLPEARSLNLSVSVGIVLYEAMRQNGFPFLKTEGQLKKYTWD